ncbi:MAG: hypothetical protein WC889_00345 [Myxococcota bacterium]
MSLDQKLLSHQLKQRDRTEDEEIGHDWAGRYNGRRQQGADRQQKNRGCRDADRLGACSLRPGSINAARRWTSVRSITRPTDINFV